MRLFFDTEHRCLVTEKELAIEFASQHDRTQTFGQFISNCLTRNSGTLEEITPRILKAWQKRMEVLP